MTDAPAPRCEGRYPVPQTAPPREEPFEVTYRCAKPYGHDGPHGDIDAPAPRSRPALDKQLTDRFDLFIGFCSSGAVPTRGDLDMLRKVSTVLNGLVEACPPPSAQEPASVMNSDWWTWTCPRCGWEAKRQLTVNPQQAVARACVQVHISQCERRSPDGDGPVSSGGHTASDGTSEPRSLGAGSEPADALPASPPPSAEAIYDAEREGRTLFQGLLQPDTPQDPLAMAFAFLRLWANSYLLKGSYWDVPQTMGHALKQVIGILERHVAASPPPSAAPAWQPIATVPTDGTRMLTWYPKSLLVAIGRREADGRWYGPGGEEPTHWMPLPAPLSAVPSTADRDEK